MSVKIIQGDAREQLALLPAASVHAAVTSPPYFNLRSYLPADHPDKALEMGSEKTPDEFVSALVEVFDGVRRVLRDDGVCFVNLGDSYASSPPGNKTLGVSAKSGLHGINDASGNYRKTLAAGHQTKRDTSRLNGIKPKDLIGIPWRFALAMQADGWYLRSAMPWIKRAVMPESTTDRPTSAVEYVFMFTKRQHYYWDAVAVQQKGAVPAGTRAAKGSNVRSDLKDVNGRPPEYWDYTGTRNFRNSDLFFSTLGDPFGLITDADGTPIALDVNPEPLPEAHFAAYPSKLVHPLILAATSERGCCAACGAPWGRQTEKRDTGRVQKMADGWDTGAGGHGTIHRTGREKGEKGVPVMADVTTGWAPSCVCNAGEPVPCTVLDPFGGAGTSGLVADRLGRSAILIELNEAYATMATNRLHKDAGLFADVAAQ